MGMGADMQKVSEWVKGHAWASVAIAFFLGFSVASGSSGEDSSALTAARSELVDLRSEVEEASALEGENLDLESNNEALAEQLDQVESELDVVQSKLELMQSKRPLPDFVGQSPSQILSLASKHDWNVSVVKQISTATPGTIISQTPSSGTTVQTGSQIKIVVAKAAPAPKPQPVAPAPAADTSSGCDPNYEGTCVPQVSYDLNCDDIGGSVTVVGSDRHGFDGDGDGYGCE